MKISSEKSSSANHASDAARRPSVALLTLDFPPSVGGVQQYLFEISRRIGPQLSLTVLTPGVDETSTPELPFAICPIRSHKTSDFWQALKQVQPDIILVGHAHPRLLIPARRSRLRYVVVAHGNDFESGQQRWHRPFFNHLLSRAWPLITNSRANARRLQQLGLPRPVVIPPGTDPSRFRPPRTGRGGPPRLLSVGRLIPRKGFDTVLEALPSVLAHTPDLQYLIAGEGPQRPALERLARERGVAHAVTFLGRVSDSELPELYRRASVFVMPARTDRSSGDVEGFGIVYLEASASGLPVIAADSGGAAEAVRDGETGLLVPPDDPDALTHALTTLLDNPAVARNMGAAGRRWVEEEMNWDRAAAQLLGILESSY